MKTSYVITGKVVSPNQVQLDEALPLEGAAVRVTVEPLENQEVRSVLDVMAQIRERQKERGHQPPSKRDVDTSVAHERNGWE